MKKKIAPDHLFSHWEKDEIISWDCPEGGYANVCSVFPGEMIDFHISTSRRNQDIYIFKEGNKRQLLHTIESPELEFQEGNKEKPYANGFDWKPTVEFQIPVDWESGIYITQFMTGLGVKEILFIVKNNQPKNKVLWVVADLTFQAYNVTGGKSAYNHHSSESSCSQKLSFNRPYSMDGTGSFLVWDQPFLAWLDRENISVDFCSQHDAVFLDYLNQYQLIIRVGHDEYWSREEMLNHLEFVNDGGNLVFFSGNNVWWQIRFEDKGRSYVVYKEEGHWPLDLRAENARDPIAKTEPEKETTLFKSLPGEFGKQTFELLGSTECGMVNYYWKPSDDKVWPGAATIGKRLLGPEEGYGGYTIHRPEHWIFENTNLKKDDIIGQEETICGTEVDGLEMEWRDGLPYPTGIDGAPLDWEILATSKTAYVQRNEIGEGGILIREAKQKRGCIINTATIEWSHGLETSEPVQQITRNIIRRLSM